MTAAEHEFETAFEDEAFSHALSQADAAAARGDIDSAERWTQLAERQCALMERILDDLQKISIRDSDREPAPNRAARRAARKALR